MNSVEIVENITSIFREILDDESITLTENSTAEDVEDWDSVTHVQLIVEIEKAFGVRFTSLEIERFKNVGDICTTIIEKQ